MDIKDFFKVEKVKGLVAAELITIIYMGITTLMLVCQWSDIQQPFRLITTRIGVLLSMAVIYAVYRLRPCRATILLRSIPAMLSLAFWYPETYQFARDLPYLDHWFAQLEWDICGMQPSIEFARAVPSVFWGEALNMGYYSYYFMMIGVMLFCLFRRYKESERAVFIFLTSFFAYYLFFELVPTAGPYYYFKAIGLEAAESGVYPNIGKYFATHNELIHAPVRGIFSQLVHDVQEAGENPVGAFPSSHVGMSTVTMLIAWHTRNRWLFWLLTPLYLLLCAATVYIMAHYLLDTIGGFISACLLYYLLYNVYNRYIHF